jgi:hypothetical protein
MENLQTTKRLICDFMGVKPLMSSPDSYYWRDGVFFSTSGSNPEKVMNDIVNYIKYDTDWNLLMSVVEKIESLDYTIIIGREICSIEPTTFNSSDKTFSTAGFCDDKLKSTYQVVTQFIQWYNQNK